MQVISEYWTELPVLYSRSLLIIYFKYSSVYVSASNSQCTALCLVCLMYLNVPLCSCDYQYFFSFYCWMEFHFYEYTTMCLAAFLLKIIRIVSIWGPLYWVGQKVSLGFSIRCYGKTSMTFLANPIHSVQFSSVQSLSRVRLFATPWIAARQPSLSITNSQSSLRLTSIESVMPSSHLILGRPLLLLPPIPPSIRVFSSESTLRMRWPKYWSFSFSIIPSKEIPGLTSFRMDWLDLLAAQGTLKSLLQQHSSKASILQHSAFFTVQLSHPYMTTGKTIALTKTDLCWQSNVSAF